MEKNVIKFHSVHPANNNSDMYRPEPVKNHKPQWFLDKDKYSKDSNGKYRTDLFRNRETRALEIHKIPSWKSCPAMLDVFSSGYYLFTPTDITFKENLQIEYDDQWGNGGGGWKFCSPRGVEDGMPHPEGYSSNTFAWVPNWKMEVDKDYTVLLTHPININDLPFKTISGFIDASNILMGTGNISFYIKENWTGTIPAGTPYAQVIPFKNDSWSSEIVNYTNEQIQENAQNTFDKYLIGPGLTRYKQTDWLKKHYE